MRIVLVEWLDSRRGGGWTPLDELRADSGPVKCKSVGWEIVKDAKAITLAGHIGESPDQCCGDITIPMRSVLSIRNIRISVRSTKNRIVKGNV